MTYVPTTWIDDVTDVDAANMNNLEAGVLAAHQDTVHEASAADKIPLTVVGKPGQTADLVKVKDSAGSSLFKIGALVAGNRVMVGDDSLPLDSRKALVRTAQMYEAEPVGVNSMPMFGFLAEARVRGTSPAGPNKPYFGLYSVMADHWSVGTWAVTGAVNNGAGKIRLTVPGHTITTGDSVGVYGVGGVPNANGQWIATVIDSSHIDLQGSTFAGTYTSGGSITNRGSMFGAFIMMLPSTPRGGLVGTAANGDDVNGVGVMNGALVNTALATSAFNVHRNSGTFGPTAPEFYGGFSVEGNTVVAFGNTGYAQQYGIDLARGTYGLGAICLPNNVPVLARNGAANADKELFRLKATDRLSIGDAGGLAFIDLDSSVAFNWSTNWADNVHLNFGLTSGSKIGAASNHKLAFWGATPVVRPAANPDTSGATLGQLETEVNELKALLRTVGLMTP